MNITISQALREWLIIKRQRPNEPLSQVIERELTKQKDKEQPQ